MFRGSCNAFMEKNMKRGFITILTLSLAFAGLSSAGYVPAAAAAPSKAEKNAKPALNQILGKLSWGMSSEKAKTIIADQIMDEFRAKTNGNSDLTFVDNTRKLHSDRIENMQKSYMQLTSDNSASLGVSIVGEEFKPDFGEAVITQREDDATKFFFFKDDKLYKIAVVYDASRMNKIAFDTFCSQTAQKYGPAAKEVWDDEGNFNEAVWTDKTNVKLTVKNKYASYSTFLMVFSDDSVESKLAQAHKEYAASLNAGPEVSSSIDALTADPTDGGDSSVDALLGKETKVNLLAGLSQEDIDIINGKTSEKEIEKKKKAKAKKAEKDRKNDAKAKQGLAIY